MTEFIPTRQLCK